MNQTDKLQQTNTSSKAFAYVLTCASFAAINYLLNAYSFVKQNIMQNFDMNETGIGLADSLRLVGVMIGLIIYTFNPFLKQKYVTYYFLTSVAYALLFMLIPIFSYLNWRSSFLIYSVNFFSGIVKAPDWVLLLQIINDPKYYNQNNPNDKFNLIIWSSLNNLGTISSLIISSIIMYNMAIQWTICIYVGSLLVILFSTLIKLSFKQKTGEERKDKEESHKKNNEEFVFTCQGSYKKITNFLFLKENYLFLFGLILLTGIEEVTMMFLPLFLKISGYQAYSGYVTAGFMGFFILGALSFSFFANGLQNKKKSESQTILQQSQLNQYLKMANDNNESKSNIQNNNQPVIQSKTEMNFNFQYIKTLSLFLLVICMFLLTINQFINETNKLTKQNVYAYAVLISLSGFFIGGPLSQYESFEILKIVNNKKIKQVLEQDKSSQSEIFNKQVKISQSKKKIYNQKFINISSQDVQIKSRKQNYHQASSQLVEKSNFSNSLQKQENFNQSSSSESSQSQKQKSDKQFQICHRSDNDDKFNQYLGQKELNKKFSLKTQLILKDQKNKLKMTNSQLIMGVIQFFNYLVVIPFLIIAGKILEANLNFFFLFLAILCISALGVDFVRLFINKSQITKQKTNI